MTLQHRVKQLERKTGFYAPQWITLFNPDEKDIERARKLPNARLFILNIGGPRSSYGLPPEKACR